MTEGGDGGGGAGGDERDWAIWLRLLSHSVRDTAVSASTDDTAVLQAVRKLHELCKIGGGGDLVARVYPSLTKLFQRCCASVVSSQRSSTGLLLLTILQFFLDFGEFVLHDGDPSLRTFFRSFLSRQYADPTVAAATIDFLNQNKTKLLLAHATLLPQYFPLLLKVVAWGSNS
jgi:AP-5 complex subunit zeta-1